MRENFILKDLSRLDAKACQFKFTHCSNTRWNATSRVAQISAQFKIIMCASNSIREIQFPSKAQTLSVINSGSHEPNKSKKMTRHMTFLAYLAILSNLLHQGKSCTTIAFLQICDRFMMCVFSANLSHRVKRNHNPFMPWSYFEPGVTNRLYMKWKDFCLGCTGPGLEVTFHWVNGTNVNDHVCLQKTADCVYKGYFSHETSTLVVVTKGCPMQSSDTMEVSFKCHLIEGFNFISRWADGATAHTLSIDSANRRDEFVEHFHHDERNLQNESLQERQGVTFPQYGFEMDIAILYDDGWRNTLHSGSDTASKAQIDAIFAHVQTYFNLPSLGTTIQLNVKEVTRAEGKMWTATGANLMAVETFVNALEGREDIDAFVVMSYNGGQSGTVGIAYLGTTCNAAKGDRTSINQFTQSNTVTAQTVAHELGHNLKFEHDFVPVNGDKSNSAAPKTCSIEQPPNNVCTNVGGIMDYYLTTFDKWSCCTREDFQNYYKQVTASGMPFCLAAASAPATTTTTPAPDPVIPEPNFGDMVMKFVIDFVQFLTGPNLAPLLMEVFDLYINHDITLIIG